MHVSPSLHQLTFTLIDQPVAQQVMSFTVSDPNTAASDPPLFFHVMACTWLFVVSLPLPRADCLSPVFDIYTCMSLVCIRKHCFDPLPSCFAGAHQGLRAASGPMEGWNKILTLSVPHGNSTVKQRHVCCTQCLLLLTLTTSSLCSLNINYLQISDLFQSHIFFLLLNFDNVTYLL